jgi:hypothetical protein
MLQCWSLASKRTPAALLLTMDVHSLSFCITPASVHKTLSVLERKLQAAVTCSWCMQVPAHSMANTHTQVGVKHLTSPPKK